jgi:hypothetical protein
VTLSADTGNFTTTPLATLSPNRPIVFRDLAVTLTNPVIGFRRADILAVQPGLIVVEFECDITPSQNSCTALARLRSRRR